MKHYLFLAASAILAIALSGCADKVPQVDDPHHIVVNGTPMKPMEFLAKYCEGKTDNETCVKVQRAMLQDSTKGAVPRF